MGRGKSKQKGGKAGGRRGRRGRGLVSHDPHVLYEASVQSVDAELEFMAETFLAERGRKLRMLREDFCGTAKLAAAWAASDPAHQAWGVDLDVPTLDWGRANHLERLAPEARARVHLVNGDVRAVREPRVDAVAAFNFSYWVFRERTELVGYFRGVRESLRRDGMLFVDAFGGTEATTLGEEKRKIKGQATPQGEPLAPFTYYWEQASFNPVDHHLICNIHFKAADGTRIERAFTYDWRFYSLAELRDAMLDAGFRRADAYTDGWDEENEEGDGVYQKVLEFEHWPGWLAYVVGVK